MKPPATYRTYKISNTDPRRKIQDIQLTYDQAAAASRAFNDNRTRNQILRGTKMEFEIE